MSRIRSTETTSHTDANGVTTTTTYVYESRIAYYVAGIEIWGVGPLVDTVMFVWRYLQSLAQSFMRRIHNDC